MGAKLSSVCALCCTASYSELDSGGARKILAPVTFTRDFVFKKFPGHALHAALFPLE